MIPTARTAIARRYPSVPAQRLFKDELLVGRMLDYGCGRGKDAETYGMACYDPYFAPEKPKGHFDTITCTYVLNVIEDCKEREQVITDIISLLEFGGRAYFTVRNDRKSLNGLTQAGTWQGEVYLDMPLLYVTPVYRTYYYVRETIPF